MSGLSLRGVSFVRPAFSVLLVIASVIAPGRGLADFKPSTLCRELRTIKAGEHRTVVVEGRYVTGLELNVLVAQKCDGPFQPATWVKIGANVRGYDRLSRALRGQTQADVIVKGELFGPQVVVSDWSHFKATLPASAGRYGHDNAFRTKLVITDVIDARPAKELVSGDSIFGCADERVPIAADLPTYPRSAQRFEVGGTVRVSVVVQDGEVVSAAPSSDGVFGRSAVASIRTWRFARGSNFVFETTFEYVMDEKSDRSTIRIDAELPQHVRITAGPDRW